MAEHRYFEHARRVRHGSISCPSRTFRQCILHRMALLRAAIHHHQNRLSNILVYSLRESEKANDVRGSEILKPYLEALRKRNLE